MHPNSAAREVDMHVLMSLTRAKMTAATSSNYQNASWSNEHHKKSGTQEGAKN